jgi:uncharacterized protein
LSGPPLYLLGFVFKREEIDNARANLIELSQEIPKIVVDHHLLRDMRCFDFIKSIKDETSGEIVVASELIGEDPNLLEARRKDFYLAAGKTNKNFKPNNDKKHQSKLF